MHLILCNPLSPRNIVTKEHHLRQELTPHVTASRDPHQQTENDPKIDFKELHVGSNRSMMLIMLQHQLAVDYTVTVSDRVNNINNSRGALKYKSMSRLV